MSEVAKKWSLRIDITNWTNRTTSWSNKVLDYQRARVKTHQFTSHLSSFLVLISQASSIFITFLHLHRYFPTNNQPAIPSRKEQKAVLICPTMKILRFMRKKVFLFFIFCLFSCTFYLLFSFFHVLYSIYLILWVIGYSSSFESIHARSLQEHHTFNRLSFDITVAEYYICLLSMRTHTKKSRLFILLW